MKTGFDNDKYIRIQSERIKERIAEFGGKLYLEFGGKLYDDFHASRVLPGFEPDSKLRMLRAIGSDVEIIIPICADDIEKNKQRGDLGISYADDTLRLMDVFSSMGFLVSGVVITQYQGQPGADNFRKKLTGLGIKSYIHYPIKNYPHNVDDIVSEDGYGRNDYVPTTQYVVRLVALLFQHLYAHLGEQALYKLRLGLELFGRGGAVGLVEIAFLMAEGVLVHVERHGQRGGLFGGKHLLQHQHEAVHGVGVLAFAVVHERQRVKRPEQKTVAVQHHYPVFHSSSRLLTYIVHCIILHFSKTCKRQFAAPASAPDLEVFCRRALACRRFL